MSLELTIDHLGTSAAVIALTGSLTLGTNLKVVEAQVQQVISDGVDRLVLDLSGCPYADSAGLGFLIHTYGLISERGGTIRLCGLGDRLKSMLEMTRTESLMPCDDNREDSIKALPGFQP